MKLILTRLSLFVFGTLVWASGMDAEDAPPRRSEQGQSDPVAESGGAADRSMDEAVKSYLALRKRVWDTRALADFKPLFPALFHKAMDKHETVIKEFLKGELMQVEGFELIKEIPLNSARMHPDTAKYIKEMGSVKVYRADIRIPYNGRFEAEMLMFKGRLYQLENF